MRAEMHESSCVNVMGEGMQEQNVPTQTVIQEVAIQERLPALLPIRIREPSKQATATRNMIEAKKQKQREEALGEKRDKGKALLVENEKNPKERPNLEGESKSATVCHLPQSFLQNNPKINPCKFANTRGGNQSTQTNPM